MVFEIEAQFQQLIHCKFRENVVRLLYIPTIKDGNVFLIVNKYGKVGLYEPEKFTLIYTYILDLSVPMQPEMSKRLTLLANTRRETLHHWPKCQTTHMVVDAIYAADVKSVVFATTKNILQWYDIGEIETQNLGLDAFPRKEYMNLKHGVSPVPLRNKGHAETHRIFGLPEIPYCMEYSHSVVTKVSTTLSNVEVVGKPVSKLIIGDMDGCITIISIKDPRSPFGKRKIRGKLHKIKIQTHGVQSAGESLVKVSIGVGIKKEKDLFHSGVVKIYKAHNDLVKELRFIAPRQLIISCSRDKKFSLFVHDFTEANDPFIISLPKGVNSFAQSESLKIIATGGDDCIIRLFNQFVMKMPQMELYGHKCGIVSLEFTNVAFSANQILISFSKDVELRAWDPVTYVCLQSLYVSFPVKSTIMCKTPEFAKRSLIVHQPNYSKLDPIADSTDGKSGSPTEAQGMQSAFQKGSDGFILLIYCNSYTRLYIDKDKANWPFDFQDFISEFEEMSTVYEKKMRKKQEAESKDPRQLKLTEDEIAHIEAKLDNYVQEITDIKRRVNRSMGVAANDSQKTLTTQKMRRQITTKHIEENKLSRGLLKDQNTVFKALPLYNLQPVELSTKNLRIPDVMKEEMGMDKISSLNDLLSQKAQRYFSSPSNMKLLDEIKAEKTRSEPDTLSSSSSSVKSPTPDELAYKVHPATLPFKTKASQNNFNDGRDDDLSSISSAVSDNNNDDITTANDDIVADDDDSDEIVEDFESIDFQQRLQKMVQSYQSTLEEQLQVPCSVNASSTTRKRISHTFSENGTETEGSNNTK